MHPSQHAPSIHTRITALFGIRHPLLLGGMHILGEAGLVAAVVNAGAMGFITARSFASPDALRADLRRCHALSDDLPPIGYLPYGRRRRGSRRFAAAAARLIWPARSGRVGYAEDGVRQYPGGGDDGGRERCGFDPGGPRGVLTTRQDD